MEKNEQLKILKEKFENLKNTCVCYNENYEKYILDFHKLPSLTENIIVPALSIDVDEGAAMWQYLLDYYYNKLPGDDSLYRITDEVLENANHTALAQVFRNYDRICEYVFLISDSSYFLYESWFIRDAVFDNEYDLADKLIPLILQNDNGEKTAQEKFFQLLMQMIDTTGWYMQSEHIDYVAKWIPSLVDSSKRDEVELKLLKAIDVVENGAPKGAMPFSMFASKGGAEKFLAERARLEAMKSQPSEQHNQAVTAGSFDEYMQQRKLKKQALENLEKDEEERTALFDMDELKACLEELNSLIGLNAVKEEVRSLTNLIQINRIREERGMVVPDFSKHLVFTGNPGTGKTTIARLLGRIYHSLGVLSKGHFVEVDRSGLVAGYVGQTAIKTQDVINKSLGGVLFIDEAYSLNVEESESDYGKEAIETLLKAMEDNRDDFVVIVAGYDDLMDSFIKSNPGLKSRFNKYIHFPDYSSEELMGIFKIQLRKNQYTVTENAGILLQKYFEFLVSHKSENFGNGREARNIFEHIISEQADRIVHLQDFTDEDLTTITEDDVKAYVFENPEFTRIETDMIKTD